MHVYFFSVFKVDYLESTSSKNVLFGMLAESSNVSALILPMTWNSKNDQLLIYWRKKQFSLSLPYF